MLGVLPPVCERAERAGVWVDRQEYVEPESIEARAGKCVIWYWRGGNRARKRVSPSQKSIRPSQPERVRPARPWSISVPRNTRAKFGRSIDMTIEYWQTPKGKATAGWMHDRVPGRYRSKSKEKGKGMIVIVSSSFRYLSSIGSFNKRTFYQALRVVVYLMAHFASEQVLFL